MGDRYNNARHLKIDKSKAMNLWLLRAIEEVVERDKGETDTNPWGYCYGCTYGMVVRAETEDEARCIATHRAGAEGDEAWLDDSYSTCVRLEHDGDAGVVMYDFHAG